jgi:hypothetical protein
MFAGGIAEILIAILHFVMPLQFIRAGEIAELSVDYRDFVFHGVVAIGLCQTVFGALSIHFSRKLLLGEKAAWVYGVSQGILWTGRAISELIFPVRVPLFFLSNPTVLVLPLIAAIALLFLLPLLAFKEELLTGE